MPRPARSRARSLTYGIGALLGRDVLRDWMGPRLNRVRRRILRQGVLAVAAIRMVPVAPFTLVNMVAGASGIKLLEYTAGTLLGLLPGLILMSALGAQIVRIVKSPSAFEIALFAICVIAWIGLSLGIQAAIRRFSGSIALSPDRRPTVRVMTWNIHGAFGRNPRFDLPRVIELILRADPDIIALQEVDSRHASEGNAFTLLQTALGNHGVGAASIVTADGEYGQLLISRWPMHETVDPRHLLWRARAAARDPRPGRNAVRKPAGGRNPSGLKHPRAAQPGARPARADRRRIALRRTRRFQRLVLAGVGAIGVAARPARPLARPHLPVLVPAVAARPDLLPARRGAGADLDRRPGAPHLRSFAGDRRRDAAVVGGVVVLVLFARRRGAQRNDENLRCVDSAPGRRSPGPGHAAPGSAFTIAARAGAAAWGNAMFDGALGVMMVIGPVVLIAALIYAVVNYRRRNRMLDQRGEKTAEELYTNSRAQRDNLGGDVGATRPSSPTPNDIT